MIKKFFLLMATILLAMPAMGSGAENVSKVNISVDARLQTVQGWGVSLCWWAAQAGNWTEEQQDEIVDWLVSPEGLNYNVFRYNIPAGDDPDHANCYPRHLARGKGLRTEMNGFVKYRPANDKDHTTWKYDWAADKAQLSILRKVVARCRYYGKEPIIEAFSNSAPWWMTVSGCASGSDNGTDTNVKREYYAAFADYIMDVCKYLESQGIAKVHSVAPFNEPTTDYWKRNGGQEGCGFENAEQVVFINKFLYPALTKSGLSAVISASDETFPGKSMHTLETYMNDGEVLSKVGQWNTHTYSSRIHTTNAVRTTLREAVAAQNKPLWMSETGEGRIGIDGNLALARIMFDDLRYLQPVVWCDWQAMEANDQWCLITCSGNQNRYATPYHRNKNYYLRQQVTRFIKPGYQLVSTDNDNVIAAINPGNDELVVCILNQGAEIACYDLAGITREWKGRGVLKTAVFYTDKTHDCSSDASFDNLANVTCPAKSITTIVLSAGKE